jgi:hypothetical protein
MICDNEWNNFDKSLQMFPEGTVTMGGTILREQFNMQMFPGGPSTMSGTILIKLCRCSLKER